ncbi:two-component sensor histidine kinase [Saccharopolyspora terrae]|uniref:histidine kinase n=1 Tax=Saccharopolyspora terrae TaxID=2530384 RepID=A0A4R4W1V9_9PSEU|nr:histidine kinase [Saccharopolyspora terrae]TDD08945.1 two-component sensor histidine kinase [Saccharopolyspora terrae]
MRGLIRYVHGRAAALPFGYPPAVVLPGHACLVVVSAVAVVQRLAAEVADWTLVGGLLTILPVVYLLVGTPNPDSGRPVGVAGCAMLGTSILLVHPVPNDLAPLILVVMLAECAAVTSVRASLTVAALAALVPTAAAAVGHLGYGLPFSLVTVALGWATGFIIRTQLRSFERERQVQAERAVQAADDERRRIAREVHDVVAHSLSITLLHLTGARRALQEDRDVDDAVEALTDAERLGRQAIADIRRTVGLLDAEPSKVRPEPGIDDIVDLVSDVVRAGVPVTYEVDGDARSVSAATGLALYRIARESLANVVKHSPGTTALVRLAIDDGVVLTVGNALPSAAGAVEPGNGIAGMRQRAELLGGRLRAGPAGDEWVVRAEFSPEPHDLLPTPGEAR